MRILHFADIHIGVENYGKIDTKSGLSTRLIDFLETYDELVSYAIDNQVDLVLFCGDAYKSRDPSQTHQREFAKRISRLASKGIPVFLLVGNHDSPHVSGKATSLEIFPTLDVPQVTIGDRTCTYKIDTLDGPIQVVAVPWIRRSAFLNSDETRGLTPDQINSAIEERLSRIIRDEVENLDENIPSVFAGHVSVSRAKTSSEQSMMLGRDHVLIHSDVALPQFDYVALGHIHCHQILNKENPMMVYSGSLQRIDFGEEKDQKGFCVIDLDVTKPQGTRLQDFTFQTVNARNFLTINVNISANDNNPTASVIKVISEHEVNDAIIRINIKLPGELEKHLNDREIRDALSNAHFIASISKEILEIEEVKLAHDYTKGLEPKEALKLYLDSRGTPDDRAEILINHAVKLMSEDNE